MSEPEPEFSHWKDAWEWHAQASKKSQSQEPVEQLLKRLAAGYYDTYYNIFYSVADRASLAQAGWLLFAVAQQRDEDGSDYLNRYHAANALLKLLAQADGVVYDDTDAAFAGTFTPAKLASDNFPERGQALAQLEALLIEKIGPPQND